MRARAAICARTHVVRASCKCARVGVCMIFCFVLCAFVSCVAIAASIQAVFNSDGWTLDLPTSEPTKGGGGGLERNGSRIEGDRGRRNSVRRGGVRREGRLEEQAAAGAAAAGQALLRCGADAMQQ